MPLGHDTHLSLYTSHSRNSDDGSLLDIDSRGGTGSSLSSLLNHPPPPNTSIHSSDVSFSSLATFRPPLPSAWHGYARKLADKEDAIKVVYSADAVIRDGVNKHHIYIMDTRGTKMELLFLPIGSKLYVRVNDALILDTCDMLTIKSVVVYDETCGIDITYNDGRTQMLPALTIDIFSRFLTIVAAELEKNKTKEQARTTAESDDPSSLIYDHVLYNKHQHQQQLHCCCCYRYRPLSMFNETHDNWPHASHPVTVSANSTLRSNNTNSSTLRSNHTNNSTLRSNHTNNSTVNSGKLGAKLPDDGRSSHKHVKNTIHSTTSAPPSALSATAVILGTQSPVPSPSDRSNRSPLSTPVLPRPQALGVAGGGQSTATATPRPPTPIPAVTTYAKRPDMQLFRDFTIQKKDRDPETKSVRRKKSSLGLRGMLEKMSTVGE